MVSSALSSDAIKRSMKELRNFWWLLPLAAIALPSRVFPRRGLTGLGRLRIKIRLRSGMVASINLNEFWPWFEVFAMNVYDDPRINWSNITSLVDIGGNTGASALWFALRARSARIVVFEPAEETASRLTRNIEKNGLSDRVEVRRLAVGANSGKGYLTEGVTSTVSQVTMVPSPGSEEVDFVDLASILQIFDGNIDFMKIDREGGEYGLFTLANSGLLSKIRFIYGEYHPAPKDTQLSFFKRINEEGMVCEIFPDGAVGGMEQGMFFAFRSVSND